MEHIKSFVTYDCADLPEIGVEHEIRPENWKELRLLHKDTQVAQVVETASRIPLDRRPNVLVKPSPGSMWHLKRCPPDEIGGKIKKARSYRKNLSRSIMYVIQWRE